MPYGERVLNTAGGGAEGDKLYATAIYNDVSGSLTLGKPVFVDVRDAAEFNTKNSTTKISPAIGATAGNVCLSTTAAGVGANLTVAGVYQPENPSEKPNKGDVIRILLYGRGIVSVQSPAAGAAGNVGSKIIASTTVTDAVPGAAVVDQTIGTLVATATFIASPTQIIAAASATATLINAFVKLV